MLVHVLQKLRDLTGVCPVEPRRPHPADEKFIPLNLRLLLENVPF